MSHAGRVVAGFGHGDEHDFDDLVTSQHEINLLRSKVQHLQAECRRWQQVQSRQVRTVSGCDRQGFWEEFTGSSSFVLVLTILRVDLVPHPAGYRTLIFLSLSL